MRRFLAFAALVTMVAAPPVLLLGLGFTDWRSIPAWTVSDVRVLLLALTLLGWVAWGVWVLAVAVELVVALSGRPVRIPTPGLGGPRALASTLIGAMLLATASTVAQAAPVRDTPLVADVPAATRVAVAPQTESSAEPPDGVRHRVQPGDDLWSLAERYYDEGSSWRQIADANPVLLQDPLADLEPGTYLAIPTPVTLLTVESGDTLSGLARAHLGDAARWPEIHALNRDRIKDPDLIHTGWVLKVPRAVATALPGDEGIGSPRQGSEQVGESSPAAEQGEAEAEASDAPVGGGSIASQGDPDVPAPDTLAPETEFAPTATLVGGISALAASAVLGGLAMRRRIQAQNRPLGRRYAQPVGELSRYEAALGRVVPSEPDVGRDQLLARAMRRLAAHWWAKGEPALVLREASLGEGDVEFAFASEPPSIPEGFTRIGTRLSVSWSTLRLMEDSDHPVAYPALVTLGRDDADRFLMIDVAASGVLGVRPDDDQDAGEVLSAMLVELACAPWSDELDLLVVTDDPAFPRAASEGRVACQSSVEAGVATIERLVRERSRFFAERGWDAGRLDPDLAEAWTAQVVLFELPPDPGQLARLESAVANHPCGVAAITVVDAEADDVDWTLSTDTSGARRVETRDALAVPQTVPAETRQALSGLYEAASATTTEPAPWWSTPAPEDDVNIIALRRSTPQLHAPVPSPENAERLESVRGVGATGAAKDGAMAQGPYLELLGPIELTGCAGDPPIRAVRQCIEYCAWLLMNPGGSPAQMTQALLVAEGTRRSNMSRLRTWLGARPDGGLYLPDAYSGRIWLDDAVTSDWQQVLLLTTGGVNRQPLERLVIILEIVRGAPLADAAPGQWGWAEEFRSDASALIRDVGVVAARTARERGDLDTSRWAANRALLAAPDDELLLAERIRTEMSAGRTDEAARLVQRITRSARNLSVDLLPETIGLCQEAMEGRRRARA